MTREERENAMHCLRVMVEEEVCEECKLYGTTGTDHCEADCVRVAIEALECMKKIKALIDNGLSKGFCEWYDEIKQAEVITEQEIVKPYLEKLKTEIEKKHAKAKQISSVLQMNAYTDCLQMIDKLLSEQEVK